VLRALGEGVSGATPEIPAPPAVEARRGLGVAPERLADVLDCAPDDLVFVRARSVEAAYRFADELDRLDFLVRAAAGDARDHGTLSGTLHDLHLPTIWRTNPDAERGVGEVALVVAPPLDRGRLRAAAILRVTDPDLHHMQTEARKDDWKRPADDPFPELRAPRNHRRRVDDVEIVATDPDLLRAVATPSAYSIRRLTPYLRVRARLNEGATEPPPEEAFMLYVSRAARERLLRAADPAGAVRRAAREELGLRRLAARWTGLPEPGGAWRVRPETTAGAHPLAAVEWIVVTTAVEGAHVRVRFVDAERAARTERALRAVLDPETDWGAACLRNLAGSAPVARVEPAVEDLAARVEVVLGWRPVCPCGGAYSSDPVTRETRCSRHATLRAPSVAAPPEARVERLARHEGQLSFDLRIDWDEDSSRPR
jgi:hypothetical protein